MNLFKVASPPGLHLCGGCTVASGLSIVKKLIRWSLLSEGSGSIISAPSRSTPGNSFGEAFHETEGHQLLAMGPGSSESCGGHRVSSAKRHLHPDLLLSPGSPTPSC